MGERCWSLRVTILCESHLTNDEWLARYGDQIEPGILERIELCFAEADRLVDEADQNDYVVELERDLEDARYERNEFEDKLCAAEEKITQLESELEAAKASAA
jgi:hypothetical protein